MSIREKLNENAVFRTVLVYAIFASLWILLSDKAAEWLFQDKATLVIASTIKGWLFVLVTSLMLWWLLQRQFAVRVEMPGDVWRSRAFIVLLLGVMALAGAAYYYSYSYTRDREVTRLRTVASLKLDQLVAWVQERDRDASFVQINPGYREKALAWQRGDLAAGRALARNLALYQESHGIGCIRAYTPDGRELPGLGGSTVVTEEIRRLAAEHGSTGAATIRLEPYQDASGRLHLDYLVPFGGGNDSAPVAVLCIDPSGIFAQLEKWPAQGGTGSVVVFRREGMQVRFLSESPSHHAGQVIDLKGSKVLVANILAAKVADGEVADGVNDAGEPVIGVVYAVPGTDWYLLTKIDQARITDAVMRDVAWIGLSAMLAIFVGLALLLISRNRQQLLVALATQEAQSDRLHALGMLDAIASASDAAIFAKDREGRYLVFNPAAETFTGKTSAEVLGKDDRAVFPPEQAELVMARSRNVLATGRVETTEELLDTSNGPRFFSATKGPLCDAEGNIIGTFGISRDVTEEKRAVHDLECSERRFRAFFDNSPDGFLVTLGDGAILEANASAQALLGYSEDELRRLDRSELIDTVDPLLAEAEATRDSAGRFRGELTVKRRGGERFPAEISAALFEDEEGRTLSSMVIRDLSARKRDEQAIRETTNRLRSLINSIPDLLWLKDLKGVYLLCNRRFEDFFGAKEAEIVGRTDYDFVDGELADAFRLHDQKVQDSGRPSTNEEEVTFASDGHKEILLTVKTPFYNADGELIGLLGVARDITGRRQTEARLQQQVGELRRFNDAVVGRELDLIELKKQVNALAAELGREAPYPLDFLKLAGMAERDGQ